MLVNTTLIEKRGKFAYHRVSIFDSRSSSLFTSSSLSHLFVLIRFFADASQIQHQSRPNTSRARVLVHVLRIECREQAIRIAECSSNRRCSLPFRPSELSTRKVYQDVYLLDYDSLSSLKQNSRPSPYLWRKIRPSSIYSTCNVTLDVFLRMLTTTIITTACPKTGLIRYCPPFPGRLRNR